MDVDFTPYHNIILECAKSYTDEEDIEECKRIICSSISDYICEHLEGTRLAIVHRGGYDEPTEYRYGYTTGVELDIINFEISYTDVDGREVTEEIDTFAELVKMVRLLINSGIEQIRFDDVINVEYEVTNTDTDISLG